MSGLSHFDQDGNAHMVDVSDKDVTDRIATAEGWIKMAPATYEIIAQGRAKKGDVIGVARLAGIMAAKKTADLIPLCHPLPITKVALELTADPDRPGVRVEATVKTSGQTGVEMEALTAVSAAALTVYDMVKAVDKAMRLTEIRLVHKDGGRLLLAASNGKGFLAETSELLAETKKAAQAVIDAFRGLKANFLVQDFVKEAAGEDIRCLVVDGKVVASMKRTGAEGDFRYNLHRGGSAKSVRITKGERETAVRAARPFGLGTTGVDLLRSESGPKVLEVNSSPGFEGIEKATGKDIVGLVYDMVEARVRPQAVRRRK